jgi:hypothetical protein
MVPALSPPRLLGRSEAWPAVAATAACAGRQVSTDYSPSIDFPHYRTFAMVSRPDSASHELVDDRVRAAVATQLTAKGLSETTRSAADL